MTNGFQVRQVGKSVRFFEVVGPTGRVFLSDLTFQEARDLRGHLTGEPTATPTGWPKFEAKLQVGGERPRVERYEFAAEDLITAIAFADRCARDLAEVLEQPVTVGALKNLPKRTAA